MNGQIAASLGILLAAGGAQTLLAGGPRPAEAGLGAADWASIRALYEAARHAAVADANGYAARNPGQQWRMVFDGRGFSAAPDSAGWSWGLELVGWGGGAERHAAGMPRCVEAAGQRVAYEWDDALTEWFINDARGLEHGYTVHRAPPAGAA